MIALHSSDSPNLHVVDGTSPGSVNMSTGQFDSEFIVLAKPENQTSTGEKQKQLQTVNIICCMAEGYEHDHDDSLSTALGEGAPVYQIFTEEI